MSTTLITTSPSSKLYKDAEARFSTEWVGPRRPTVINVFYVNRQGQTVWYNYEDYKKRVGNEQYMYCGARRACNIGDDNLQTTACQLVNCDLCHILRGHFKPPLVRAHSTAFGVGIQANPNPSNAFLRPWPRNNRNHANSPNVVIMRCAVAVGKAYPAKTTMPGVTQPPTNYDSITALTRAQGGVSSHSLTVIFKEEAILPVELIVLRFSTSSPYVSPYSRFTKKLINASSADWSRYPEAIKDTGPGDILWTDGYESFTFPSAPKIRAYKVVRRNPPDSPTGRVVAEGYAAANPFYFKLV